LPGPARIADNPAVGVRYEIDREFELVVAVATGRIGDADLIDYAERLHADPDRGKAKHELVDLRHVARDSDVSSAGVRQLAEFWSDRADTIAGGRLAIIAPSDVGYGMSRMYQILRSDGPDSIQVFRDLVEALRWVGVDEALADRVRFPD
jgi:hypothetical protein